MSNPSLKSTAPCFVGEGTIINKKDMIRVLETLDAVHYSYVVDGKTVDEGDGTVVKVFGSGDSSTLVVNGCLFLNILSWSHLRFAPGKEGTSKVELIEGTRRLTMQPLPVDKRCPVKMREMVGGLCHYDESCGELLDDGSPEPDDDFR